jgi:hypothetical protein
LREVGEVEIGGYWFEASQRKKLARAYLKKEAGHSDKCLDSQPLEK